MVCKKRAPRRKGSFDVTTLFFLTFFLSFLFQYWRLYLWPPHVLGKLCKTPLPPALLNLLFENNGLIVLRGMTLKSLGSPGNLVISLLEEATLHP